MKHVKLFEAWEFDEFDDDENPDLEDSNFMTYSEMSPREKKYHKYLEDRGYYENSANYYPRDMKNAIYDYMGNSDINKKLRDGQVTKESDLIDAAFELPISRLLHDEVLHRRVSHFDNDFKVGETFIDKAYISTSIDEDSKSADENTLKFIINARQGQKAILVSWRNMYDSEFEFLLPRNSRFLITDVDGKTIKMDYLN